MKWTELLMQVDKEYKKTTQRDNSDVPTESFTMFNKDGSDTSIWKFISVESNSLEILALLGQHPAAHGVATPVATLTD